VARLFTSKERHRYGKIGAWVSNANRRRVHLRPEPEEMVESTPEKGSLPNIKKKTSKAARMPTRGRKKSKSVTGWKKKKRPFPNLEFGKDLGV